MTVTPRSRSTTMTASAGGCSRPTACWPWPNSAGSCVDAVFIDPPYGIAFGGKPGTGQPSVRPSSDGEQLSDDEAFERWTRVWASGGRRVLKPGGIMVAFGAPRTVHALTRGVEEAGLEIRDQLMWLYAQGCRSRGCLPAGLAPRSSLPTSRLCSRGHPSRHDAAQPQSMGNGSIEHRRCPRERPVAGARRCCLTLSAASRPGARQRMSGRDAGRDSAERLESDVLLRQSDRAEREAGLEQFPVRSVQLYTGQTRLPRLRANRPSDSETDSP